MSKTNITDEKGTYSIINQCSLISKSEVEDISQLELRSYVIRKDMMSPKTTLVLVSENSPEFNLPGFFIISFMLSDPDLVRYLKSANIPFDVKYNDSINEFGKLAFNVYCSNNKVRTLDIDIKNKGETVE